jgi:hypothetical protein|tara:strand:+ start:1308 stop:1682 length:375 start_codon:yes stop_codon:yes gene_type:complete
MKKFIALLIVLTLTSCVRDEDFIIEPVTEVPEALVIDDLVGIKLESSIVSERVAMNVKLPEEGVYRIKIRHGMNNELISQERVTGKEGDNILKVYVSALDKSSYMLELTNEFHVVIGRTAFTVL